MIPTKDKARVNSTVKGTAVAMTLAQDALAHIMDVLTNLYANPRLACIREYATNALDSHIAAGQTRPIDVETPTDLRPYLRIRDYGIGLTGGDIAETLSRYGASTKRESNEAVGMLGIGCKSALAYVDQFTIVGFKDGERTAVSVARDESGAGTMTVLEAGPTDEPNGAEILIPTHDAEMATEAREFFAHWEPGTVLLNGTVPTPLDGLEFGDFTVVKGAFRSGVRVVMGNVPYPAPGDYRHDVVTALPPGTVLVARVPIGTMQFAPSREALRECAATNAELDSLLDEFRAAVHEATAEYVESAPTRPAAVRALSDLREAVGPRNLGEDSPTWRGEEIPLRINLRRDEDVWSTGSYRGRGGRTSLGSLGTLEAAAGLWVTEFKGANWSAQQRQKLNAYAAAHGLSDDAGGERVYLTESVCPPAGEWLGHSRSISWERVRAWKDPNAASAARPTGGGRTYAGTYCYFVDGSWYNDVSAEVIAEADDKVVYYYVGRKRSQAAYFVSEALGADALVVVLPEGRKAKFLRTFPNAQEAGPAAEREAVKWWRALKPAEREAVYLRRGRSYGDPEWRLLAPAEDIADPALRAIVSASVADPDNSIYDAYIRREFLLPADVRQGKAKVSTAGLLERYPVLSYIPAHDQKKVWGDVKLYVNAAHAARTQEAN